MGGNLADGIFQGNAGADQFRSAPLWGVGQRIFFLHDGRTKDLLAAIAAHSSGEGNDDSDRPSYPASEANAVIHQFNALPASDKQAILDFLRSL